jgi:hypothetical protein
VFFLLPDAARTIAFVAAEIRIPARPGRRRGEAQEIRRSSTCDDPPGNYYGTIDTDHTPLNNGTHVSCATAASGHRRPQ